MNHALKLCVQRLLALAPGRIAFDVASAEGPGLFFKIRVVESAFS